MTRRELDQTYTVSDTVILNHGKHNFRFGGDYRRILQSFQAARNAAGTFTFTGFATGLYVDGVQKQGTGIDFADFLLGLPQQSSVQFGTNSYNFRANSYDFFTQDDWRIRANLTLLLGLRYEYQGPFSEANNQIVNLDVAPGFTAAVPVVPGQVGQYFGVYPDTLIQPDRNNFAPRLGLAWKPMKNTVVRAGYGINYNLAQYGAVIQNFAFQPPFAENSSHRQRTAENSAAYLLPLLAPGMQLLDVGCGPGTITLDLGARLAPGRTIGVDREAGVIAEAQRLLESRPISGVEFRTADAYALEFDDESFDVVHAHQLLQHLTDPVAALVEMRRVLRSNGLLAVRDSDYGGFVWAPSDPLLDRWMQLYHDVCRRNGADADAGRSLLGWAQTAGFTEIQPSSSTWTFAEPESRQWWGELWADRMVFSSVAQQAVDYGLSSPDELQAIAAAWRHWLEQDDGFFVVVHAELIAWR